MAPRYITPQGFRRLAEEHERIWSVERPRIVAEVEAAAALGDRSENAEYLYGKRKLRELDRRLRFLSERMDALTVVEPRPDGRGRAFFGAWVTVEHEDGSERTYRLVGPDEFDVPRGHISVEAPLGRALLGKRQGDVVVVQRPVGAVDVTVVEVSWTAPAQTRSGDEPPLPPRSAGQTRSGDEPPLPPRSAGQTRSGDEP